MTGQWFKEEQRAVYKCSARKRGSGCGCPQIDANKIEHLVRTKIGLDLLSKANLAAS
jgi:hypothetical protein